MSTVVSRVRDDFNVRCAHILANMEAVRTLRAVTTVRTTASLLTSYETGRASRPPTVVKQGLL